MRKRLRVLAMLGSSAALQSAWPVELAATQAMPLRAGFASAEMTPGSDGVLFGYDFRSGKLAPGHDGVHDPLHLRVLVLRRDKQTAAIASLDCAVIDTATAREYRKAIAEGLDTDMAHVIVAATHTHSGAYMSPKQLPPEVKDNSAVVKATAAYGELVRQKLRETAIRAGALTFPVNLYYREAPLGLGYNRRVNTPQGVRNCWSPQEWPDRQPGPSPDPTCSVVMLKESIGSRSTLLWSLGVHPVVLGKTSKVVSADYPGRACQLIEEANPGCRSMFFLGGAGNIHPWIATQDDPKAVETVARGAASFVSLLAQGMAPAPDSDWRTAAATLKIGAYELDVSVWRIGQVWIVAAPVELFAELSAGLRQRLNGPVLLATMANGWCGYFPTRAAFAEGGYEVDGQVKSKSLAPGDSECLVDELVKLAETIKE
ncbi:MAG: hypothetical protein WCI20_02555 [bacterium]